MRYSLQLLKKAQAGDTASLELLLDECRVDLPRYARHYCAVSNVEDAVQETLLIVFRTLPSLRSPEAFASYLFKVLRRECTRLGRAFGLNTEAFLADDDRFVFYPTHELRLEIAMAIQSIPQIYRDVILLRDFEELSVREIAQQLNLNPATVKTRLHRGKEMMRDYLLA